MPSATVSTPADPRLRFIAPWPYTVLVVLIMALASLASWRQQGLANVHIPGLTWRLRSLRPGMLAHGLQDVAGGIAAFLS